MAGNKPRAAAGLVALPQQIDNVSAARASPVSSGTLEKSNESLMAPRVAPRAEENPPLASSIPALVYGSLIL